jgi:hypothetical protein
MNRMLTGAAAEPPSEDEAATHILDGLDRLDYARAEGLRRGAAIQRTQAAGAARERDRLAAKYGAGHPRVRMAQARVATEQRLATAVATQADQAKTPPARIDDDTWVVQGRVLCADGTPAQGLTVALWFQDGGWDRTGGYMCTDHNGAFTLRYRPTDPDVRLQLVVSQGTAVLHRDTLIFTPEPGTLDTRVIVLRDQAGLCPPPEPTAGPQDGAGGGREGIGGDPDGIGGDPDVGGGGREAVRGAWAVRGRVTHADGRPAAGLTVSLYDKDLFFDDRLGETTTNNDGDYAFSYRTRDFRDFIERRPDLFIKVLDENGETLHRTRARVRMEAGHDEVIDLRLPRGK